MKVTIEVDLERESVLNRHLDDIKMYEKVGFSGAHPTDAILRRGCEMRLAKEIREALVESGISLVRLQTDDGKPVTILSGGNGAPDSSSVGTAYGVADETVIAIIAAKLEPVRGALLYVKSYHETGVGQLTHVLAAVDTALALLSEEE